MPTEGDSPLFLADPVRHPGGPQVGHHATRQVGPGGYGHLPGHRKQDVTRFPWTSTTATVRLSPMTTFSPGFLLRTSIILLHALGIGPWPSVRRVGFFRQSACHDCPGAGGRRKCPDFRGILRHWLALRRVGGGDGCQRGPPGCAILSVNQTNRHQGEAWQSRQWASYVLSPTHVAIQSNNFFRPRSNPLCLCRDCYRGRYRLPGTAYSRLARRIGKMTFKARGARKGTAKEKSS